MAGLLLVCGWPLDLVDHERFNRPLRCFQSQAELLLDCRKQIRLSGFRRSTQPHPFELSFVGRPLQVEIVSSGKPRPIHHRAVERAPLERRGQLSATGRVARPGNQDDFGPDGKDSRGGGPSGDASAATALSLSFDPPFATVNA